MHITYQSTRRDYFFGALSGLLIGLLILPILKTAKPDLYEHIWPVVASAFVIIVPIGIIVADQLSRHLRFIWQLAKFAVIGVMNALVDIGILAVIIAVSAGTFHTGASSTFFTVASVSFAFYSFFKAVSFFFANVNSYFWNKYWTFSATNASEKSHSQFGQFLLVSIVGFFVNNIIATSVFSGVHPLFGSNSAQWGLISAGAGSVLGLGWNFIGYKFIVFKK